MDSLILTRNIGNTNTPDDIFIRRLYNYHLKGGFRNIVVENGISLLINYFLIFFINFLTNSVDYTALVNLDDEEKHHISEFIHMSRIFPSSPYLIICFVVYSIYLICSTINVITTIRIAYDIKNIYQNKLNIDKTQIQLISWEKIVEKIMAIYNDPNLNPYTISSKIMRQENLTIALFRYRNFTKSKMTKFLEWNFIYCFITSLFDKNGNITDITVSNYKNRVKQHLWIVLAINILALPFILYIILIYSCIKYGEKFYHHPELITERQWTIKAKWRLRYYNELPHQYTNRKKNISNILTKILDSREHYATTSIIVRFINFILGSFFILLLVMSLINDNILTDCLVAGNKNVLWFLGVIGAFILVCRKATKPNETLHREKEEKLFNALKEYISSINPKWFEYENRSHSISLLSSLYQYKVSFIFLEIWNLILSPLHIWRWSKEINNINLTEILDDHCILGYVAKKSIFTNFQILSRNPHTFSSLSEFRINNESWNSASLWYQQALDSFIGDDNNFNWSVFEENNKNTENINTIHNRNGKVYHRVNSDPNFNNILDTTIIFGND